MTVMIIKFIMVVIMMTVLIDISIICAVIIIMVNVNTNIFYYFQIKSLPSLLVLTSTNHTNLLHVMQVLPPSPRGTKLRQLTSVVLVKFFVKELTSGNEIIDIKERTEALQSLCKTNKFEVHVLQWFAL